MKLISILLAIIHSVSALVLLLFSGWFIAECAIVGVNYADVNFNYLLPAVIIRALALTRIASGYSQMWTGHHALLSRIKKLRSQLFARLFNRLIRRRSEGTEALAQHSEVIARITMAWTVHNISLAFIIVTAGIAITIWLPEWLILWFGFIAILSLILGLGLTKIRKHSRQIAKLKNDFRHRSEHHLSSASLWHLYPKTTSLDMSGIHRQIIRQQGQSERMLWWTQLSTLSILLYVLNTGYYNGQAVAMIFILLLLAAKDWLAPSLRSQNAFSDYRESINSIKQLPLKNIPTAKTQPTKIKFMSLTNFTAKERPVNAIDLTIKAGEIICLKGSSGCGKTSLLKAIAGLLPHTGNKTVNQAQLPCGRIENWHYSDQSPTVLSAGLADNLRLACPDADNEQLHQALHFADLSHLTDLSQWLGEQGRRLSGGELKRLNIARAYLFPAELYLFDEPFEGLNPEKQELMAKAIQALSSRAPVIIASHIFPKNLKANQVKTIDSFSKK